MEKTGGTINDAGESQIKDHESILKSENHNEAAQPGYKDNQYFSDYVTLHRTTTDSCGRRSMAYFHKPTGKIIPDTERSDDIPTQSLRDANRRKDILQCRMLCEGVRPQLLRQGLQYLMKPMYWFCEILSLFILFWDGYHEHKALHAEENEGDNFTTQPTSEVEPCTDDEFSNLIPLEKTALDAYGQRSMAFFNKKTGAVLTTTDIIEHDALDLPMRKYQRRLDVACCWLLCENIRPEILKTTLRAIGFPIFCIFLGISSLLFERDLERKMKES
jgi:hypothetical protein